MRRPLFAVLMILAATRAEALVTADQVWDAWQGLAADAGGTLTAVAERRGAQLVLSDLTLAVGTEAEPSSLHLDEVVLEDNADGTVSVILPANFPVTLDLPPSPVKTDPDLLTFNTSAPDLAFIITDIGEAAAFSLRAPSLTVSLAPLDMPAGAEEDLTLTVAAADVSLDHRQNFGAADKTLESTFGLGTLHADITLHLPDDEGGSFTIDLSALKGGLSLFGPAVLGEADDDAAPDFLRALEDGMAFGLDLTHGPLSIAAQAVETGNTVASFQLTTASGAARTGLDRAGFVYEVSSGATRLDALLNDPAVPISDFGMGYDEVAMGLSFGILPISGPQELATFVRLREFTLSDAIWDEMDATRSFPRDPMSLSLGLSGSGVIKPEALEPGWQPQSDTDLPFEVETLSIDDLLLSGLGVSFSGSGALGFDNTDVATFDGLPAPTGVLRFMATGVNGLIDRMASLNLLGPDEVMPLRLGLAFIAKPGEGADTLTTTVEFRDKSLILNGIKLR